MKQFNLISFLAIINLLMMACTPTPKEVTIDGKVWMTQNLNVDTFRNGDPILEARTNEEYNQAGENEEPVWCYYDNNPSNAAIYGKLYNWYAIMDSRGLAPEGWRIATYDDWKKVEIFLGDDVANKIKSRNNWKEDAHGSNESGFSALPGGLRNDYGFNRGIGYEGFWWSPKWGIKNYSDSDKNIYLSENLKIGNSKKTHGLSVRCLKDSK